MRLKVDECVAVIYRFGKWWRITWWGPIATMHGDVFPLEFER